MTFFSYPEQKARKYCINQNHTFVKEVVKHICETTLCVCAEFQTFLAAVIVDDLVSNKLILTGTVFSFLFTNELEKNI